MAYSSNHITHIVKTPLRKTFTSTLEAKFKFKEEVKLESEADPNYQKEIRERIGRYESQYGNVLEYLSREGFLQTSYNSGSLKKGDINATIRFYLFSPGFDLTIEADGIVPEKDLFNLSALNDYVLKGNNDSYDSHGSYDNDSVLGFDNSDKTIDDSGLALGGDEDDLDDSSDSVIIPLDNDANNGVDND